MPTTRDAQHITVKQPQEPHLTTQDRLRARWEAQRRAFRERGAPEYAERVAALNAILQGVFARQEEFVQAISDDFGGRAREETLLLEIFPLADEIRHIRRNLREWMRPEPVPVGWQFLPGRARIIYQPLGVVGILGAWNYPLYLTLCPLVNALAAGNHALVKPSELAPRTAELLKTMTAELFPEEYVTVITGDAKVAAAFSALPFDHLLFTGSTHIGKLVMRAAGEHLTPVTLELGGKSPAIVHREYDPRRAVDKILVGKLYNAGQTCVAPDYVLVHESRQGEFLDAAMELVPRLYPRLVENPDYTRIISPQHYERLRTLVGDARGKGARIVEINPADEECNAENRVFPPTFALDVHDEMLVMREEIFGPILPIVPYETLDDAIEYVNERPRPLALYYFDRSKSRIEEVLWRTISGGVTVNDVLFHIAQHGLPFGGVGPSGLGHYHGIHGFRTFSKAKGVYFQSRWAGTRLLRPPYAKIPKVLIRTLLGRR